MLRYVTSGESHGKCLTAILEGIPAGLKIDEKTINYELARRQKGFGRGKRMQIETDRVSITAGVRQGETIGSPICLTIFNKDWENWKSVMSLEKTDFDQALKQTRPRPGHADLAGMLKYQRDDIRDILERASARETAIKVAVGAVCKKFLLEFGIKTASYTNEIFNIKAQEPNLRIEDIIRITEQSPLRCTDKKAEMLMIKAIEEADAKGNTLGGIFTVILTGVPVGLGSHSQWDLRLDGKIAQAFMSIQAIKGVEIGGGFNTAKKLGSQAHDEIFFSPNKGYFRKTNNAGGIEGGISNGETITIRAAMKPIPSLKNPLNSVDTKTKKPVKGQIVRSDTCAVPAACVIGESAAAIVIAGELKEKFGGDSMKEILLNFRNYLSSIKKM